MKDIPWVDFSPLLLAQHDPDTAIFHKDYDSGIDAYY